MTERIMASSTSINPFRLCHFSPETTLLTLTFVYKEALALAKDDDIEVISATVHAARVEAEGAEDALGSLFVLYRESKGALLKAAIKGAIKRPLKALSLGAMAINDTIKLARTGEISGSLLWQAFTSFRFAEFLEDHKIDHVHIHFAHVATQIGMYASHLTGIPFTVMAHANDIFEEGRLLKEKGERSSGFAMISDYNIRALFEDGVPTDKMSLIRCGVDIPPAVERPSPEARPFRIGALGRLIEKKGMGTTIDAVKHLVDAGKDVHLDIVGQGPLQDILQEQVDRLGLQEHVTLCGSMPNEQVMEWLSTLHIMAMACQRDAKGDMDGIPVAMMEAMAVGVPVVSTQLSGIPELVIDGTTGLLCQPEDPKGMADTISNLMDAPERVSALGHAARQHVQAEFSEKTNIARLRAFIGLPPTADKRDVIS